MNIRIKNELKSAYLDVYTPEVISALASLARFNNTQKMLMTKRIERRIERARKKQSIEFLNAEDYIQGTNIKVKV